MGYDFTVMARPLVLNQITGKVRMDYMDYTREVPVEFRRFIYNRGYIFDKYRYGDESYLEPSIILENFPDWSVIEEGNTDEDDDSWTEDDHNAFKKAMEWFSAAEIYIVTWSF